MRKIDPAAFCSAVDLEYIDVDPANTNYYARDGVLYSADGTLLGDNTDAAGFTAMLRRLSVDPAGKKALVLGSGGASVTVKAALEQLGASVTVISRSGPDNYDNLERHADAQIIANTTPVGMYPRNGIAVVDIGASPIAWGFWTLCITPPGRP